MKQKFKTIFVCIFIGGKMFVLQFISIQKFFTQFSYISVFYFQNLEEMISINVHRGGSCIFCSSHTTSLVTEIV